MLATLISLHRRLLDAIARNARASARLVDTQRASRALRKSIQRSRDPSNGASASPRLRSP